MIRNPGYWKKEISYLQVKSYPQHNVATSSALTSFPVRY